LETDNNTQLLTKSIDRLCVAVESLVETLTQESLKEKEKKRTKRKEKETHVESDLYLKLDQQIDTTDLVNKYKPIKAILPDLGRRKVQRVMIDKWIDLYGDAQWICEEIKKAEIWMVGNPRAPKSQFGRFFSTWLSRGWDRHRKTLTAEAGDRQEGVKSAINRVFEQREESR